MTTQLLHFRIGEDTGRLLARIAQEKITCEFNPIKAVKVITDSLPGCPDDLVLSIIKGDHVIEVVTEDDHEMFNVCPRNPELHQAWPVLDIIDWYNRKFDQIGDDGQSIYHALESLTTHVIREKTLDITIPYEIIMRYVMNKDTVEIGEYAAELAMNNERIDDIATLIRISKQYLDKTYLLWGTFAWLEKAYPKVFDAWDWESEDTAMFKKENRRIIDTGRHMVVDQIGYRLMALTKFDINELRKIDADDSEDIEEFFEFQRNIDSVLEKIKPVDIKDGYNAGWIAPNGDVYALKGVISNMLHNQIADALEKAGIIQPDEMHKGNPDAWMCRKGWVRYHDGWILYEGYDNIRIDEPVIAITEEQINKIYIYGQMCCEGLLKIGIAQRQMSAARFHMTEIPMMQRLFSFS